MRSHLFPVLLAAFLFHVGSASSATFGKPNILVILADDLGWGDLSCYAARDLKTPRIDHLLAEGVRMNHFFANCPVCSPTRAALLTGRYPDRVGVPGVIRTHPENSWGRLDPAAVLLPVPLNQLGYQTGIVGKWHLGLEKPDRPTDRGFQFFHGFLGDMMDDYYTHQRHGNDYMRLGEQEVHPKGHATDVFTDWAIQFIQEASRKDQPWFLYLAYNAPHTPIQPPADWLKKVQEREPGISDKRAKLVALIEHLDHGVGRVLDAIDGSGVRDNTLVIFTSDNGGQLDVGANNGPYRDGKQSMYEGGIRVPFGARWPGHIPAGSSSDRMALSMDLYPTVLAAAGLESVDHAIEGISILPSLLGRPQTLQRDLYWVRREGGIRYNGKTIEAFRRGDWKLVQNTPFEPLQLFNLKDDPYEETDLAGKNRGKLQELAAGMRLAIQEGGRIPWQKPVEAKKDSHR